MAKLNGKAIPITLVIFLLTGAGGWFTLKADVKNMKEIHEKDICKVEKAPLDIAEMKPQIAAVKEAVQEIKLEQRAMSQDIKDILRAVSR